MKIIDRYIIKKFIGTFLFIVIILTAIAVVFDTSEKLQDFFNSGLGPLEILDQYTQNFALWIANLLSPLIIFLSVIWVCSRMASRSENIAILSGGHSFNRLLRPYLISGVLLFGLLMFMSHFVVPRSRYKQLQYENAHTNFQRTKSQQYLELEKGTVVYYSQFNYTNNLANRFSLKKFKEDSLGRKVKYFDLQCLTAQGDSSSNNWIITNYHIREIGANGETVRTGEKLDTTFSFRGPELGIRAESLSAMETPDLIEHRDFEIEKGSGDVNKAEIELHNRTAVPFSIFILIILAVCISYKKKRSGLGLNLIFGLAIGAVSLLISKITSVASTNAGLDPFIAAWISNLLFAFVTLLFYLRARR